MDQAKFHVLKVIDGCHSMQHAGMPLAPAVAGYVTRALRLSLDEDEPIRSKNPNDPLCRFMVGVFGLLDIHVADGTMSDMLRGRYRSSERSPNRRARKERKTRARNTKKK